MPKGNSIRHLLQRLLSHEAPEKEANDKSKALSRISRLYFNHSPSM